MELATQEEIVGRELHVFQERINELIDPKWSPDVKLIAQHIHACLSDPSLSVGGVRRHFGLRSNGYSWHFKRCCRTTMRRYIEDRRMLAAMRLLTFAGLEVGMIVYRIGYSSPRVFSRAFKRHLGCTPTQFRVSVRQKSYRPPRRVCPRAFRRLVRAA